MGDGYRGFKEEWHLCAKCKKNKTKWVYCNPCAAKYQKARRDKDPEGHNRYLREWHRKGKERVIEHYGGKCACCGETRIEFLTIDHKNNNGNEERRRLNRKSWKLAVMRGFPDDLQILCYNCNMAKAHFGICPHERERGNT